MQVNTENVKKALISVNLLFLFSLSLLAQNGINELGARSNGMGNAYSTISDKWSLFNNPGGIGRLQETSAVATYLNRYGITGLSSTGAGFLTNFNYLNAGIAAYKFGDDLYNESIASIIAGNNFGIASIGIRANYLQYSIEGQGTSGVFTLDFGGNAQLTEELTVGAYIRNINQGKVSEINDQRAPTILYAGISYKANDKLFLATEVEKDIDFDARFKMGLEYKFLEKFIVRTGVSTNDFTNYLGLGFISQKLGIDYALTYDDILGLSHQASLSYTIKK